MLFLNLPFSKPPAPPAAGGSAPRAAPSEADLLRQEVEDLKLSLELHKLVLARYRKFIEDGEAKTVSELRSLVRPMDPQVVELKLTLLDSFHPYVYEAHFLPALQKALDAILSYRAVRLPLSFWMSFGDMVRLQAADDIDRAMLLCSLIRAFGNDTARVLIRRDKAAFVSFQHAGQTHLIDIERRVMSAFAPGDEKLRQIMYDIEYAFNDKEYEDLSKE